MSLIQLPQICRNFPSDPLVKIERESQLDAIETAIKGSIQVVFVDGDEGIGKTTVLSQLMERHPDTAIGIFISPINKISYSKDYINLAIAEQIYWMFEGIRFPQDYAAPSDVLKLMLRLQRQAKTSSIIFVVDGLADIDIVDRQTVIDYLFEEILQLGFREFRYVIAGTLEKIKLPGYEKLLTQTQYVLPFDRTQIKKYFEKYDLDDTSINDIKEFSKGIPSRIEVAFRALRAGESLEEIISHTYNGSADFFEIDWQRLKKSKIENWELILALIAFSSRTLTVLDLSRILKIDADFLIQSLAEIYFIDVKFSEKKVKCRSESQRKFITKKLENIRVKAQNILIEDLVVRPTDRDSLSFLPTQLMDAGKYDLILGTLTNEHFQKLLFEEKSISALKSQATIGRNTAEKLKDIGNTVQFSIMGSVLIDIENCDSSRMMVQALLTLGDVEKAIAIAGEATTKEDRFSLLSQIGKYLISEKKNFPSELKEQIIEASKHVNFENLGNKAHNVANNLISIDPDLAIEVLQASVRSNDDNMVRDLAFASFYAATSASNLEEDKRDEVQQKAKDHISNVKVQGFAEAASAVFSKYSAVRIIEKLEKLGFEHRMFFARIWLTENRKNKDAAAVAEFSLNLMVEQTEYIPKLRDFRPILAILPFMEDRVKANAILDNVESQRVVIAAQGTSEEYTRLNMLFLISNSVDNLDKAIERSIDIFSQIDDIKDIGTQTTCFAWVLHYMHDCHQKEILEGHTDLESASALRLMECIDKLLASTVDHFNITKQAIKALALNHPKKAYEICGRLNTNESRNKAFRKLSQSIVENKSYSNGFSYLLDSIDSITRLIEKDHAGMDMIAQIKENDDFNIKNSRANEILNYWKKLNGPDIRMLGLAYTFSILSKNYKSAALGLNLEKNLGPCWDEMPDGGYKLNIGFQVVEILAPHDKELAEKWMKKVTYDYSRHTTISEEVEPIISLAIHLSIRSFTGLVKANSVSETSYIRLINLIKSLPGTHEQIKLWIDLAVRCWAAGDKPRCEEITTRYIRPIIDQLSEEYSSWRAYLITQAAPALYISTPNLAERYLISLPRKEQDIARSTICSTLYSQLSPYDPKPTQEVTEYTLDYARASDIISLIEKMKSDSTLLFSIGTLCNCLVSKKNRHSFTTIQKKKIIQDLSKIVAELLPDQENILHLGYQIAAKARILRVLSDIEKVDLTQWKNLKTLADDIPNIADRALVLCMIAVQASSKEIVNAKSWIQEARILAAEIPSARDKIDRFRWMSEMVGKIDSSFCHSTLKEAFELSGSLSRGEDIEEQQREILDIAHQIDPKLADELLILSDHDPARKNAKNLTNHLKILKTRKKLFDKKDKETNELELSDKELIEISSANFKSMLADRYSTRHLDEMNFLLTRAANIPLIKSFPIWSWFIENVNRRFKQSPKELSAISAVMDASMSAAELACYLGGRTGSLKKPKATSSNLFRDGDREDAMRELRSWISTNIEDEILISDPYFGPDELEILKIIKEANPNALIRLLLSEEYINKYIGSGSYESLFREKWNDISDEEPPRIDIVIVGIKPNGSHPIHDRWLLSKKNGIRLGTSIHSIGIGKTSEISSIAASDLESRRDEIESYLNRDVRNFNGNRISYNIVDI